MGKFDTDQDLARSKYIIIASVAAVAMVLGAMSVGALYRKNPAGGHANPVLSQIYPIPASDNDDDSSSNKKTSGKPEQITPSFTKEQTIPLATHQDWGKKALLTDPVNLQVRVGLTQAGVQANALGLNVGLPPVKDVLQDVTGIIDDVGSGATTSTPSDTGNTGNQNGTGGDQTPSATTEQTPPKDEQASTLGANSELIVTP